MPRTARIVIPDIPHHVIQRGNRRQDVFFTEEDNKRYLALLSELATAGDFSVHAYCLMRNHVHLIITPHHANGLRQLSQVHRRYAYYLNQKMDWRGFLWQGRFASYPMDERYCYEAVRYVEMNPVRAGICPHPTAYRWSSARQRVGKHSTYDYPVAALPAMQHAVTDWDHYWRESLERQDITQTFADNEQRQKPLGSLPDTKGTH
jgi:putative transposase